MAERSLRSAWIVILQPAERSYELGCKAARLTHSKTHAPEVSDPSSGKPVATAGSTNSSYS